MGKLDDNYIRSGEFAKISGVNKQTLFFYDKIHLFSPAFVDTQGYRYYTFAQLDVFSTIMALKTIGMSLEEIRKYIDTRTARTTQELFKSCIGKTRDKITELEILSREMEKKIELIEKAGSIRCGEVYIEHQEKQYLQCSPYIAGDAADMERYVCIGGLSEYRLRHQLHCGHAMGGMVEKAFLEHPKGNQTKYCRYFTVIDNPEKDKGNMEKSAGNYLVLYYKGPYDKTFLAYPQILEYSASHKMILGDYAYEESLIDEISECRSENYITQITVPFTFSG